jgi:hypothetical protein
MKKSIGSIQKSPSNPKKPKFESIEDVKKYFKDVDSPIAEAILFLAGEIEDVHKYTSYVEDQLNGYED